MSENIAGFISNNGFAAKFLVGKTSTQHEVPNILLYHAPLFCHYPQTPNGVTSHFHSHCQPKVLLTGAGALIIGIWTCRYFKVQKDIFQAAMSGDLELVKHHFIANQQCVHFKMAK